jgi:YgiT-type zinc finger domain-containing protein
LIDNNNLAIRWNAYIAKPRCSEEQHLSVSITSGRLRQRNGYHISWDAIPAWVCEQCGESLFETPEVDTIQSAIAVLDRDTASLVNT